uniref:TIR domain-containing protein n=1 Tax=Candidatus Kentrum sp. TC TaxID=2126339 RepID=A0A450YZW7_9GAMM|nr:MAG: TIR domain-containing protein [Candidatus Kentron sp. TC]
MFLFLLLMKISRIYKDFKSHLESLERIRLVKSWHDRMITAGSEWKGVIDSKLEQSSVVLLLISASFVESEYCFDIELEKALPMLLPRKH